VERAQTRPESNVEYPDIDKFGSIMSSADFRGIGEAVKFVGWYALTTFKLEAPEVKWGEAYEEDDKGRLVRFAFTNDITIRLTRLKYGEYNLELLADKESIKSKRELRLLIREAVDEYSRLRAEAKQRILDAEI